MTNDTKENINPTFYSSEIKKLDPIYKEKDKEKIEYVETFRSSGKVRSEYNLCIYFSYCKRRLKNFAKQ